MAESTGKYSKSYMAANGKKATISIWTGEDEEAFAGSKEGEEDYEASKSLAFDSQMKLAGVIDSEITRYKEKLLNQHLDNLDNNIVVPTAPTGSPLIEQFKIKNEFAKQKETREILMANVDKEYKKTDIQIKLKDLQLKESFNSMVEASLIMQGNFYIQNEKMIAGFERINNNLGELRGTLSSLNEKLSSQKEHYDFMKKGSSDLKDSNGNLISPREVQAKINAEKLIDQEDINRTTIDELLEFIPDLVGGAGNQVGELLGTTDGFDINFNPLHYISGMFLDKLKDELEGKNAI